MHQTIRLEARPRPKLTDLKRFVTQCILYGRKMVEEEDNDDNWSWNFEGAPIFDINGWKEEGKTTVNVYRLELIGDYYEPIDSSMITVFEDYDPDWRKAEGVCSCGNCAMADREYCFSCYEDMRIDDAYAREYK